VPKSTARATSRPKEFQAIAVEAGKPGSQLAAGSASPVATAYGARPCGSAICVLVQRLLSAFAVLSRSVLILLWSLALPRPAAAQTLRNIKRLLVHEATPPAEMARLRKLAADPRTRALRWAPGRPLREARNAHRTHTTTLLAKALQRDVNSFEGDLWLQWPVRSIPGLNRFREPIMAHSALDSDGMTYHEWLSIVAPTERLVITDVKHAAAIPKVIAEARQFDIPDRRRVFNADVIAGPGGPPRLLMLAERLLMQRAPRVQDMRQFRLAFPDSTIALGARTSPRPEGTTYTPAQVRAFIRFAEALGGPIEFALRAEFVTPETVAALNPYGEVKVWSDPKSYNPPDRERAAEEFRAMGVTGIIDLWGGE
jgi:Uncharacterized conserved protein (DUF2181)